MAGRTGGGMVGWVDETTGFPSENGESAVGLK